MAIIVSVISYIHLKKANNFREKYDSLAYQHFFYRLMIPYLVTWYACFFHPLFISGLPLLPFWISIVICVIFIIMFAITEIHIERAGFMTITHGMDIYTIFPEEATIVRGEIYSFIRHPLYFSLTCGCFGLAFFKNNLIAIIAAFLQLIPCIISGILEDNELIKRTGEEHKEYIKNTSLLFPFRKPFKFLKLLFFFK